MAKFTEEQLLNLNGRILIVTLPRKAESQELIKGRLRTWDGEALELAGDDETADPLVPHDDLAPQGWGVVLHRLEPGKSRRIPYADLVEVTWSQ